MIDTVVIGGGIAGMATAARLQAAGKSTRVLEAHSTVGGCAGYFRRRGFAFDVGATTLVDFEPGGVGGEFLESIDMPPVRGEALPGYCAWLPDRMVRLHREPRLWSRERLRRLGDSTRHRAFFRRLDQLADVFWRVSRRGGRLPLRSLSDVRRGLCALGPSNLPALRYLSLTMGDLLRRQGLRDDRALVGLLSMLVEDTVHASIDEAPAVNAALGVTIRGAGLTRAHGGMARFWEDFVAHYARLGGQLDLRCRVTGVRGRLGAFTVVTSRGEVRARQVVCAIPAPRAAELGLPGLTDILEPYLRRDADSLGGAVAVFLGVPDEEVEDHSWTHHQILEEYDAPLGEGNNMFISVSAPNDDDCAPPGFRAAMLTSHCGLAGWEREDRTRYRERKEAIGRRLLAIARKVYPRLANDAVVYEVGTPATYARFTHRPRGAVGGVRLTLDNSNQNAIPHDVGIPGFRLVGDTTWPGLGTVACVLGSRIVAEDLLAERPARRGRPPGSPTSRPPLVGASR